MRFGLDAMGSDHGTETVVTGALQAVPRLDPEDVIVLLGDENEIRDALGDKSPEQIEIIHAPQTIGMGDSPVEALRTKPDSSIALLASLQKEGKLDASISGGNTGACVAAAQMRLGRLPGVHRPGIAIIAPSLDNPVAICDVGANVNCRPIHLYQYAVMTSLYIQAALETENPRIGLVSVGEEAGKGNELVKNTNAMLEADPELNFIGNVEGRDLITGVCDVMVCEGFVGNVILKMMESMGMTWMKTIIKQMIKTMPDQFERIMQMVEDFKNKYDFNEYGGAPLLGVAGIFMICHGATSPEGFANAVLAAKSFAAHEVNQHITERLSESS